MDQHTVGTQTLPIAPQNFYKEAGKIYDEPNFAYRIIIVFVAVLIVSIWWYIMDMVLRNSRAASLDIQIMKKLPSQTDQDLRDRFGGAHQLFHNVRDTNNKNPSPGNFARDMYNAPRDETNYGISIEKPKLQDQTTNQKS